MTYKAEIRVHKEELPVLLQKLQQFSQGQWISVKKYAENKKR